MSLVSYKNDKNLKDLFVKEIEKHRKADMILQGTYGKQNGTWKGCAVACSLRSLDIINKKELVTEYNQHQKYEIELGIPEWLARLEDTIFEGLPVKDAKKWVGDFAKAIPVGVNLEPVKWTFCAYLMKENIDRVLKLKISDDLKKQVVDAVRGVLNLYEVAIQTGKWDESAESAAWSAAWSAARSAESAESAAWSAGSAESAAWSARSAAWSAGSAAESAAESAWSAAWSAARSAESAESAARSAESAWSARSAARSAESAAWSAAWSAARSAAYQKHAKELLKLLKESK